MNKKTFLKKALMAVVAVVVAIGISIGSAMWVHSKKLNHIEKSN